MATLTSRQRMLRTLALEEADYVPCCFMSFGALRKRCGDDAHEVALAELRMGLDSMLFIPAAPRSSRPEHPDLRGLPVRVAHGVRTRTWREPATGGEASVLCKEYVTPAGTLTTRVQRSDDWPHGDRIPLVDDYQIPRCLKPLVTVDSDLESLEYLLEAPSKEDVAAFRREAERAHAFASQQGLLVAGGWGVGMDMAAWLCGLENLILLQSRQSKLAQELLAMIHRWNMWRMQVVLEAPVDLYIRRGWYEGCDFVLRDFYRQAVLPQIKAEADLAHERGAQFGLICTSGTRPFVDAYREAGIDLLVGIDPVQGTYTDLSVLKARLGDRLCLWGGVSAAVTLEMGSEQEVRTAVGEAMGTLGPRGFVLSPVDNVTVDAPQTWRNVRAFIDEWQRCR